MKTLLLFIVFISISFTSAKAAHQNDVARDLEPNSEKYMRVVNNERVLMDDSAFGDNLEQRFEENNEHERIMDNTGDSDMVQQMDDNDDDDDDDDDDDGDDGDSDMVQQMDDNEEADDDDDWDDEYDYTEEKDDDDDDYDDIISRVKNGFIVPRPFGPPTTAPAGTINKPVRVSFDTSNNFDDETHDDAEDEGLNFRAGSASDEDASDWSVVTSAGYEYQAHKSELRSVFGTAQYSSADDEGETFTDTPIPDEEEVIRPPGQPGRPSGPPNGPLPIHATNIGIQKRSVFPPDTRKRVRNPRRFPWSAIGRFDNGCTGFFIGPRHILTAGHCVYSQRTKKWSNKLNFRRGKNCGRCSGTRYIWRRAITVNGWRKRFWPSYDYAMVVVTRSSPVRLRYSFRFFMPKWTINIAGYPGDKPRRCMWHSSCKIQHRYTKMLGYRCDTYGGNSGSPVYVYWPKSKKRVVYGIHAYGKSRRVNRNRCVRITRFRYRQFKRWIRRN